MKLKVIIKGHSFRCSELIIHQEVLENYSIGVANESPILGRKYGELEIYPETLEEITFIEKDQNSVIGSIPLHYLYFNYSVSVKHISQFIPHFMLKLNLYGIYYMEKEKFPKKSLNNPPRNILIF